ncbi:unnamed protein product [Adineta ricciae]|uniref:Uncharacterized protein n=1 Tax=Adineta ricciae TaxID=249248 RepID=A0A815GNA7_ADIRI|nr:unnamed protein product [Adineta ricciae]
MNPNNRTKLEISVKTVEKKEDRIVSPFSHTLGFIRWNSAFVNRIPLMERYRPFFYELHYSIPNYTPKLNLTVDGLVSISFPYKMVSETMTIILKEHPEINGILFFHFDAWINPFKFHDMNFDNIWFLDGPLPPLPRGTFRLWINPKDIYLTVIQQMQDQYTRDQKTNKLSAAADKDWIFILTILTIAPQHGLQSKMQKLK